MQDKIESDLKNALLSGDKVRVETLRGLKSAIHNEAIVLGAKDRELNEEQIVKVLARESKKRLEAAELYKKGGNFQRAEAELSEKAIIDSYLPKQVSKTEIAAAVDQELAKLKSPTVTDMGKIIGAVKAKFGPRADGAVIASITKEKLSQ
jgi:hypothetical protein